MTAGPLDMAPEGAPGRRRVHGSIVVGGVITAAMVAVALISLVWTPYDPALTES